MLRERPLTPYAPRTPSAPRTPRNPSRAQQFAQYARYYPSTPGRGSEQSFVDLLLSRITVNISDPRSTLESSADIEQDVEELSTRLTEAPTAEQAQSIFERELVSVNPEVMPRLLQDITRNIHPSTELYRQALKKEKALKKLEDLKEGDPRALNIAWLEAQWKGSQWLPEDVRQASAMSGSQHEPSNGLVTNMAKITSLVLEKGIPLHSLWTHGGPLRNAVSCHMAGKHRMVGDSGQGYPLFGLSQEIIDITVDCIGLPVANDRYSGYCPQKPPQRRSRQVSPTATSRCSRFRSTLDDFKPEELNTLRARAKRDLEKAETEKAAADVALGNIKGREDQLKEIFHQSDMYMQHEADDLGNGYKASQAFLVDLQATVSKVYIEGLLALKHSLLQTYPGSQDQSVDGARQAEAAENLRNAKQRVYTLDRLQKATFLQNSWDEAKYHQSKIIALLDETNERLIRMEEEWMQAFHDSESENWAPIIENYRNKHH
ncbi:hypothetical protein ACHAPU_000847 [Fusarium lateritium]